MLNLPGKWPALLLPLMLLGGCASTPQATPERDVDAKQFISYPATAAVYVYRDDLGVQPDDSVLYVDNRLIGATLPRSYFRVDLRPGKHVLHGVAYDNGSMEIQVRPDTTYFVSLTVLSGTSHFELRDVHTGRRELLACCGLLENWAPGQRPLLH